MNLSRGVVTLDGPAGSGKSTLAAMIAEKYPFYQIDSGALYRAFTYLAMLRMENHPEFLNGQWENLDEETTDILLSHRVEIAFGGEGTDGKKQRLLCEISGEKRELSSELRGKKITDSIKYIADSRKIRERVNSIIRNVANDFPVVADGRDMGTVVFPDADIHFFITASPEERARRRYMEMKEKDPNADYDEILASIISRDCADEQRKFGGLRQPFDAIFVDTTTLNLKVAFQSIERVILEKFKALR